VPRIVPPRKITITLPGPVLVSCEFVDAVGVVVVLEEEVDGVVGVVLGVFVDGVTAAGGDVVLGVEVDELVFGFDAGAGLVWCTNW
jgi:hypothetical protein